MAPKVGAAMDKEMREMNPDYLFPSRTIAILAFALIVDLIVAGLTYAKDWSWPAAALAGLAACGGAVVGLHAVVGP